MDAKRTISSPLVLIRPVCYSDIFVENVNNLLRELHKRVKSERKWDCKSLIWFLLEVCTFAQKLKLVFCNFLIRRVQKQKNCC